MSEHIDNSNLFDSGGHRWSWGRQEQNRKEFSCPGVDGAGGMVIQNGPRPGQIEGTLKASASDRGGADTALAAQEKDIEDLRRSGLAKAWEDDHGNSGESLVIISFVPVGQRVYGQSGDQVEAWQHYVCEVREMDGKP